MINSFLSFKTELKKLPEPETDHKQSLSSKSSNFYSLAQLIVEPGSAISMFCFIKLIWLKSLKLFVWPSVGSCELIVAVAELKV
jgi:hypothetical protein